MNFTISFLNLSFSNNIKELKVKINMTRKKIYEHLTYILRYDTDGEKIYAYNTQDVLFKIIDYKVYDTDGNLKYEIKGNYIYELNSSIIRFDIK